MLLYENLSYGRSNSSQIDSNEFTVQLQRFHCARPTPIPASGRRRALPRVAAPAILALRARRSYPFEGPGCFSSIPSPSLRSRRVEHEQAAAEPCAGQPSPPQLVSARPNLPRHVPHPRRTAPTSIRLLTGRNRAVAAIRHRRPPLKLHPRR